MDAFVDKVGDNDFRGKKDDIYLDESPTETNPCTCFFLVKCF